MILICEPVCYNFEHGEVNYSLLKLFNLTFSEEIIFIADQTHLDFIQKLNNNDLTNINFIYKNNPLNNGHLLKRFYSQFIYFKSIFSFAKINNTSKLFFSAITIPGIICIKLFSFLYPKLEVKIIGHAIFENLKHKDENNLNSYIHYVVKFFHPQNLTYIFYGKGNHLKLTKFYHNLKSNLFSFDLPYIFKNINTNINFNSAIYIGSLGIARIDKGSGKFFQFAKEIKKNIHLKKINFLQIGKVIDLPYLDYNTYIDFLSPNTSIPYEKYIELNSKIHFSIYFYETDAYGLTVSASFYDSISFGKPIIAIRNSFFKTYFDRFGDIGYLVDNYQELVDLMSNFNNNFDLKRYKQQVYNISIAADLLSIDSVSIYLKSQNF